MTPRLSPRPRPSRPRVGHVRVIPAVYDWAAEPEEKKR